jgi:hypothetical protein
MWTERYRAVTVDARGMMGTRGARQSIRDRIGPPRGMSMTLDNDAFTYGIQNDLGGVVKIQLLHQIAAMCLDG